MLVNVVPRHANILFWQPLPASLGATLHLQNHETTPHLRPAIWLHTQAWAPQGWAGQGLVPGGAKITYHPGPQLAPRRPKFCSRRPGLIPRRLTTLCLEKKGAAGITSSKSALPARLQLCTHHLPPDQCLANTSPILLPRLHLFCLSLLFSFHTKPGRWSSLSPC